jgi:integrase
MTPKALTLVEGTKSTPLAALVDIYLDHDPKWSRRTRDQYTYNLHRVFLPWAEEASITEPEQLDDKALTALHRQLADHLKPSSVHSYLRSVNQFLNWARKRGEVGEAKAELPRLKRRMLEVLSRDELSRMEASAALERDKLIIRCMADAGLRLDETLGLRPTDLVKKGRDHELRVVRAKGGNERMVPIAPALWGRLKKYADHGRHSDATTKRLFTTERRHADGTYSALEPRTVQNMIKVVAEKAGIERRVHPHLLRHSYATWMLDRGLNPIALMGNMGHADLDMIAKVYSHLSAGQRFDATMLAMQREDE